MPLNFVAKAAIAVGVSALNMVVQSTRNLGDRGRVDDLAVTQGDYGAPIPRIWSTRRIEGAPIFWAEPLTEVKRRRKTKGGKYNEFTYFGSWACAAACHQIAGVTRIWFDKHLVYDATGAGPVTALTSARGFVLADHIRFYDGGETQEADPYMLASVEAAQGAGSCPAYRGTAYIMFEQIPLEKFGNRIPQITIEVAGAITPSYPRQLVSPGGPTVVRENSLSPDGQRLWRYAFNEAIEIWDVPSRSLIVAVDVNGSTNKPYVSSKFAFLKNGSVYYCDSGQDRLLRRDAEGNGVTEIASFIPTAQQSDVWVLTDGDGVEHWMTKASATDDQIYVDGEYRDMSAVTGTFFRVRSYFSDSWGSIWAAGDASDTVAAFYRIIDSGGPAGVPDFFTVTGLADISGGGGAGDSGLVAARWYSSAAVSHIVLQWGAVKLYAIDLETQAVTIDRAGIDDADEWARFLPDGASTAWIGATQVSLATLATLQTVDITDWGGSGSSDLLFDGHNEALIEFNTTSATLAWNYLGRGTGDATTLQAICDDAAALCGITSADFLAFAGISVDGWSVTSATGADMISPLLDIYDCDVRPHDFGVQGVVRGGASGGTIDYLDFVPGEGGRYAVKIAQAAAMPRALVLQFADRDHDQQVNAVRASRGEGASDSDAESSIDMSDWVADADTAQQALNRYFRRIWNSREVIANQLTAQQISLEPADLRTLALESDDRLCRLMRATWQASGVLAAEFVADDPSLHLIDGAAGPGFDGWTGDVISVPAPAATFVIDAPLARDGDDGALPFLYYASGPYVSGGFSGADFAVSDSGADVDFVDGWAAVDGGSAIDWGRCTDVLGDALAYVIDEANSLNVQMAQGTPTGATEAEIIADGTLNLVLVGQEWLQFRTATLEGDGSYTLTGLLRGRRGTEWAMAGHAAGEKALFWSARLFRREVGAGEIGDTDRYRAVAAGRDVAGATEVSVTFAANAHRPYAPVEGVLLRDTGSGDWTISATRRTRVGGANYWSGGSVPLGEASESWEADVMDGASVKRTLTGTSLPLTYTSAQQSADWGAAQTSLEVNLYQISPALALRGFALNIAA